MPLIARLISASSAFRSAPRALTSAEPHANGEPLQGKGAAPELLEDWGLDLDEKRPTADLKPSWGGKTRQPKLVQKILFSMPAGTPPKKVLAAVKNFAREEFGAAMHSQSWRQILSFVWWLVRLPMVTLLLILEPVISFTFSGLALLGVLMTLCTT